MSDEASHENNPASDFETRVAGGNPGLVLDIGGLLLQNKKWWLLPIFSSRLGLFCVLLIFGSTGAAPFIHTLF